MGWSIAEHTRTSLVVDVLKAALAERGCMAGTSFTPITAPSADNAAAESFNASLKRETLDGKGLKRWESVKHARLAVFAWINRYNTRRRHSANGRLSPLIYEQRTANLELAA